MINKSAIVKNVIASAKPFLEERKINDLVIGVSLAAVQLDNGFIGISYVHKDEISSQCGAGYVGEALKKPAFEIVEKPIRSLDPITSIDQTMASALLCAASQGQDIPDDSNSNFFGIDFEKNDIVGMIGYIAPIVRSLEAKGCELIVFDKGLYDEGQEGIYNNDRQKELLVKCNKTIITGSAFTNGSIDGVLEHCKNSKEIAIVGTSTPMFAKGFEGTNVSVLAGAWWKSEAKEEIFRIISSGGGIRHLHKFMKKKALRIK